MLRPARLSVLTALCLPLALCAPGLTAEPTCPPSAVMPTPDQLHEAARNARDRGALWRFERDSRHGYLYGTIHIANLDWAMPGPTVGRALREAETVAIEADPGDPATGAGIAAPQKPHEAPSLPAALLDRLRGQAARACEPWDTLESMPPLMIVTRLTLLDARWDGLHTNYSIEAVLAAFARRTSKNLALLETVAIQRAAIIAGSPAEQMLEIDRRLVALENGSARQAVAAIANACGQGDVDTLRRLVASPQAPGTLVRTARAQQRCTAAPTGELHRGGQRVFAAAGILHMVGD